MTLAHAATEKPLVMTHSSEIARARADEIAADIRARARAVATGDLKVVSEIKFDPNQERDEYGRWTEGGGGSGGVGAPVPLPIDPAKVEAKT